MKKGTRRTSVGLRPTMFAPARRASPTISSVSAVRAMIGVVALVPPELRTDRINSNPFNLGMLMSVMIISGKYRSNAASASSPSSALMM